MTGISFNLTADMLVTLIESSPDAQERLSTLLSLGGRQEEASPYMTVNEAADYLRCKPQRIHDLLSARKLTRVKEGARTLVVRDEVEALAVYHPCTTHPRNGLDRRLAP